MVDFRALGDNLKRALRSAKERFSSRHTPPDIREVSIHDVEFTSTHPFAARWTKRQARATPLIEGRTDIVYLIDEVKIGVQCDSRKHYFALQATGFVERLADFYDGDTAAVTADLLPLHQAAGQLFKQN